MMTYKSKGVLLTLTIVGCAMAQSGNAAEEAGLGTVVPEAEMTVFCQNAAGQDLKCNSTPLRRIRQLAVRESFWFWARLIVTTTTVIPASTAASNRTEPISG